MLGVIQQPQTNIHIPIVRCVMTTAWFSVRGGYGVRFHTVQFGTITTLPDMEMNNSPSFNINSKAYPIHLHPTQIRNLISNNA